MRMYLDKGFKRFLILLVLVTGVLGGLTQGIVEGQVVSGTISEEREFTLEKESLNSTSATTSSNIIYKDNAYSWKVSYPGTWNVSVAFENGKNNINVINKRIIFNATNDEVITVDVWERDGTLQSVFKSLHHSKYLKSDTPTNVNVTVSGKNAILSENFDYTNGNLMHAVVFTKNNNTFYRIVYSIKNGINYAEFKQFVRSFKFIGNTDITYSLPFKSLPVLESNLARQDSCGGYYQQGNPFPCCASGGNCTWWAIYKRPDLINKITWGNAGQDWINQAKDANLQISQDPLIGSIAVWGPVPEYGRSGHVAYVNSVSSANSFNISEMNCYGAAAGPRDVNVNKNYSDYWYLPNLGFIGGDNAVNSCSGYNQTMRDWNVSTSTTCNPTGTFTILPSSLLNSLNGTITIRSN